MCRTKMIMFLLFILEATVCAQNNEYIEKQLRLLKHSDPSVRRSSAQKLGIIGERIIFDLANTLQDPSPHVRAAAANSLGRIGEKVKITIPSLISANHDKKTKIAKILALENISCQPTKKIISHLINMSEDSSPQVREISTWVLGEIGKKIKKVSFTLLKEILLSISKLQNDPYWKVRETALFALRKAGGRKNKKVIEATINALEDTHRHVKITAIHILGTLTKEEKVITTLIKILNEDDKLVRLAAVQSLVRLKVQTDKIVHVLISGLKDKDKAVKIMSLKILGSIEIEIKGIEKILPILVNILNNKDRNMKIWVIKTAKELVNRPFKPIFAMFILKKSLQNEDPFVREIAAEIIKQVEKK